MTSLASCRWELANECHARYTIERRVRRDVYDRTTRIPYDDSEMNPAEAYPFVDEVMADDDADDPTLAYYQGES